MEFFLFCVEFLFACELWVFAMRDFNFVRTVACEMSIKLMLIALSLPHCLYIISRRKFTASNSLENPQILVKGSLKIKIMP